MQLNLFAVTYDITIKGENLTLQTDRITLKNALNMVDTNLQRLGICSNGACGFDICCHVLLEDPASAGTYFKLCPVIFHDAAQPEQWKLEDLKDW